MYQIGILGTGHMGSALARAAAKTIPAGDIMLANRTASKAAALAAELGADASNDKLVSAASRYIILAVKPQLMAELFDEIAPVLAARTDRFILVTIAAGLTMARIEELSGKPCPVIRLMPNTPCTIGEGVILCTKNELVTDEEYQQFKQIMNAAGQLADLPESLIDAGCALSGCGPAFVYTFIESLADAGVSLGLPRQDALTLAAATVRGSASMVLKGEEHPSQLRDDVCSPGGATIEGVKSLEAGGFRAAVMQAADAAYRRTVELGK